MKKHAAKTNRIHCVVVRVPAPANADSFSEHAAATAVAASPVLHGQVARGEDEVLPWADPYILGVIEKLKREVDAERTAGVTLEFDDACFDFDMEIEELLADGYALAGAEFAASELLAEEGLELPTLVRLPR